MSGDVPDVGESGLAKGLESEYGCASSEGLSAVEGRVWGDEGNERDERGSFICSDSLGEGCG